MGIIALNLVGQVIQSENIPGAPSYVSNHYQPSHISAAAGAMADLSLDVNVDPITAGKIREINKHKEAAVAKEDYDEAKRLKLAIERLKAVGQKVAQLEARKRQACNGQPVQFAGQLLLSYFTDNVLIMQQASVLQARVKYHQWTPLCNRDLLTCAVHPCTYTDCTESCT